MKRKTYFLLALVGLLALLLVAMSPNSFWKSSAQRLRQENQDDLESRKFKYETYEPREAFGYEKYEASNILQLEYGDGEKQAGLITDVEDFRSMGPMSFDIKGEAIYILDEVNDRAKVFNRTGDLIRSLEVSQGSSDIAVDSNDRLYVLDRRTNSIAEYQVGSDSPSRYASKEPIDVLRSDVQNGVSVKMRDSNSYELERSNDELTWRLSSEPYTCIKVDDRSGRVTNNASGQFFNVTTQNSFGSISYLGTDREQNIYIVVEELLPGDTIQVIKEVRKYTASGKQIAKIPVNIDYVAHPEKELILDEDGNVFHLLPLNDRLIVQKWSRQY